MKSKKLHGKKIGVDRNFVIFLRASKVVNDLELIIEVYLNNEDARCFKNCKWPILKKYEQGAGICANCGIYHLWAPFRTMQKTILRALVTPSP